MIFDSDNNSRHVRRGSRMGTQALDKGEDGEETEKQ